MSTLETFDARGGVGSGELHAQDGVRIGLAGKGQDGSGVRQEERVAAAAREETNAGVALALIGFKAQREIAIALGGDFLRR